MSGISVVIPARNRSLVIGRALDSIYAQTLLPDEIVLVDDGSDDSGATIATARSHARDTVPMRIIELPERRGAPNARNVGVAASSGDWVALLDSDDAFAPTKLASQVALIDDATVAIFTDTRFDHEDGTQTTKFRGTAPQTADLIYRNVFGGCSAAMVRREAFDAVGGFDTSLSSCQDWDLWLKLSDRGLIRASMEPLTLYFFDGADRISRNPDKILRGHRIVFDRIAARSGSAPEAAALRRYHAFHLAQTKIYFTGTTHGVIGAALRELAWPSPQGGRRPALHLLMTTVMAKLRGRPPAA